MAMALLAAAWVRGYSGFGFAALVVSAAGLVTNPLHFVPVVLLADIGMTVQQVRGIWGEIDWPLLAMFAGLFVVVVLGGIARWSGFSIFRFLRYIKEELLLVLGTSSSETALPLMIHKLRGLGCAPATVGLVVPTGYSFNLDGTNIYMTMAAVFLAQATNTPLDLGQQFSLLLVAMITSKGASGVTGAGFITLAATLAVVPGIPVESLALIVGIDRFMSECRALTNFIGNGVATVAISRWEGEVTPGVLKANLRDPVRLPEPG